MTMIMMLMMMEVAMSMTMMTMMVVLLLMTMVMMIVMVIMMTRVDVPFEVNITLPENCTEHGVLPIVARKVLVRSDMFEMGSP